MQLEIKYFSVFTVESIVCVFIFILLYVFPSFAQETEEPQFVIARNGLIVRDQPSIKGKKLNKLPYRTEVVIKEHTGNRFTVSDHGYKIQGEWVQIKNDSVSSAPSYVFNGFLQSSEVIHSSYDVFSDINKNKLKDILNVYPFNKDLYGIVIPITDGDLNLKPYYNENTNHEDESKDLINTGVYKKTLLDLYKNSVVTKKYNGLIGQDYYIYGTKKIYQTKVKDVLFHWEIVGCHGTYIILIIDTPNKQLVGEAVMASTERLEIVYNKYFKEVAQYNYNMDMRSMWADCSFSEDDGHITVFGKYDNFYLGYRNTDELYRTIFHITSDDLVIDYSDSMDLFGCGC